MINNQFPITNNQIINNQSMNNNQFTKHQVPNGLQLSNINNQTNSKSVIWNLIIGHCLSFGHCNLVIDYFLMLGGSNGRH
jgi:hypothetical protein